MKQQIPIEQARNSDLRGSAAALLRAAQRAREVAMRTQTALVVRRNGQLMHDRITDTTGKTVATDKV
jgi:hypothetical protein